MWIIQSLKLFKQLTKMKVYIITPDILRLYKCDEMGIKIVYISHLNSEKSLEVDKAKELTC